MAMENQHAKLMLDIEVYRSRQAKNSMFLEAEMEKVKAREREIDELQQNFDQKALLTTRKQRELDIVMKKFLALKEIFDVSLYLLHVVYEGPISLDKQTLDKC